jgi:hypothetical protein
MFIEIMPFINHPRIFGSIVVSISACHSKEQLAGGRGSIPRQRVNDFYPFLLFRHDLWCGAVWGGRHRGFFWWSVVCALPPPFLSDISSWLSL